ncbi:alanine--tRNA ligase [Candidatus Peribacteria bacterium RIFCSPHIGHO2_02_FULL_53_20]|nr:MAG: alanine--tRNA ligase [Candidatus Peribacteria bacterium RIFCSPHIGHO2_02_FULL_53_20]OGJ68248.1 MAG: alanine--tRNA ligase [Candidatus Peribacteria bacterium RIFCSPLOWO2_01_FULL_53_10]OGJ70242.1 MAG: alanine--tRNA ligase [Candidatus Peribacteria bacterium RIFCSPLOWO2_12_FULL_53_10]
MQPLTTDEIRQAYLDFFKKNGHAIIPGASLIPENDPTVLFTTAGMHPLVPYILGEPHPAGKRLCDVQRCIRTQDIDDVGDSSHLTMFEMLGNWSLGDYFKEGAITMSFEFLTEVLGIPLSHLAVTCFEGDKDAPKDMESANIWMKVGLPEERIGFLPKTKNWWGPAGATGPCGPDTEMFYWVGPTELPPAGSNPATDEKHWLEIWNDVLIQYNKTEKGTFVELPQKTIDTGMGLERVAAVLQGVPTVYDTDRMKPILDHVLKLSPRERILDDHAMESGILRHARIIVDHVKAATFLIGDGIKPGNVDQGYVLRRIIRRAIRSARQLQIPTTGECTPVLAEAVIREYGHVYGYLKTKEKEICDTLSAEERQFGKTLAEGLKHFERVAKESPKIMSGENAFHLYDTYGFPMELTEELAAERGLHVDEAGYKKAFEEHQKLSRAGAEKRFAGGLADHSGETTKLHTATHLLNAALRKILGNHVWQKGSNITAERLRFDFSHESKMTPEQIKQVEELVNWAIEKDFPIWYHITTVEGAKKENAIGVFDDRYQAEVKVYVVGDKEVTFSKEICGGPHVARTGMLGSFTIQKEESSSSGIRRIKAVVAGGPGEIEVAGEA